jgi:hypothetical protein
MVSINAFEKYSWYFIKAYKFDVIMLMKVLRYDSALREEITYVSQEYIPSVSKT